MEGLSCEGWDVNDLNWEEGVIEKISGRGLTVFISSFGTWTETESL
jgi:hypothetical protein